MKIGNIEGNLEEYVAHKQDITVEEAKKLIDEFYTLNMFSEELGVPVEFLKKLGISSNDNVIKIIYKGENNNYLTTQRIYKDSPRKWVSGTFGDLYGLWKLNEFQDKSYIVLTRTEESTIKLWLNGIQAIGKPKKFSLKLNHIDILNSFEKVYIINKNEEHSIKLINSVCANLFFEKIYEINLDEDHDEKILNSENIHTFAKKMSQEEYNRHAGIKEIPLFNNILKPRVEKHVVSGKKVLEKLHLKYYANSLYTYNNTYYEKDNDNSIIKKEILKISENIKSTTINEIIKHLKIKCAVNYNELDSDNIIFLNGRLNLESRELLQHSPEVFNIFRLNVNYKDKSTIETNTAVEQLLSKLSNKERKALLQYIGYILSNRTDLNTFCCIIGNAINLKLILSEIIVKIIGVENTCNIPLHKINDKFKYELITNKLLNVVNEISTEEVKDVITFKNLVAGNRVEIKSSGKETTYMKTVTKHLFFGRNLPKLKEGTYDEGFLKQMLVIKCEEDVEVDESEIFDKSALEYITSIAIKEYLEMLDNEKIEFANKEESNRIVAEYKEGNVEDSIQEFINSEDGLDSCFEEVVKKVRIKDIYESYKNWCEDNEYKPMMRKKLIDEILKTGRYEDTIGLGGYDCLKRKLDI